MSTVNNPELFINLGSANPIPIAKMKILSVESLEASGAQFQDIWSKAKKSIATGGTLCVHIANITVFYNITYLYISL